MTFNNKTIRRNILKILAKPTYTPQKAKNLLPQLGLQLDDAKELRQLVKEMISSGEIVYGQRHQLLLGRPAADSPAAETTLTKSAKAKTKKSQKSATTPPVLDQQSAHFTTNRSVTGHCVTGKFQRRPSGIGFVRPRVAVGEETPSGDIFIPAHWTRDAASGDIVVVEILQRGEESRRKDDYGKSTRHAKWSTKSHQKWGRRDGENREERGSRGRVTEILQRASNRFVGTYVIENDWAYIQVDASIFKRKIPIGDASAATSAQSGDKIVVEMVKFPTPHNDGAAVIVEVLGRHGVPGLDTLLVMRQFDLPERFRDDALAAANQEVKKFFKLFPNDEMPQTDKEKENVAKILSKAKRTDLTDLLTITIDPADARDFDDAVSLEKRADGGFRLGVHIADVTYFVPKDSAIDHDAVDRATSVYLPDRVIPMLPEVLSNALASLQPGKIRYTKSVFMEFNPEGIRTHTEICRSAIRSARRFNYDEVQDFYDKKSMGKQWKPEIQELLTNLHGFMQLSRKRRFARGSLEMDIPETKIVLDESGKVADAHVYPYYDSNRVIEECMLAANEAVADFLAEKNISFIRRVHSGPSSRKLRGFTDFIHALGLNKWDTDDFYHDRKNIQRLLDTVRGTAQEYAVNFSLLRAMQRAVYAVEPEGHYALASDCYTHYTSPIRRYPDLSVHRLLDEILDGKTPQPDLRAQILLAEHCSDREQRATDAERELTKLKIIDYLSQHIGEYIEAMVTTVEPFGVFVMGTKIPAEGLIRIEGLRDDVYRFEPSAKILMGQRNDNTLRIGDRLLVEVVRADADARQVDFCLVKRLKRDQSAPKTVAKKPRKRK